MEIPSPVQEIHDIFPFKSFIKRDDLIHPEVSGNKYRKLKFIVQQSLSERKKGLLTFGGAFSNHIYAVASYAEMIGLPSAAIIRGEEDMHNPSLAFARSKGMELFFVSRNAYRNKDSNEIQSIVSAFPEFGIIPEGGNHPLAMKGIEEMIKELASIPDYIICSAGTGTTAAGILKSIYEQQWNTKLLVFSSMKNDELAKTILEKAGKESNDQFEFNNEFHFGGYAKTSNELLEFVDLFLKKTSIPLDPIYTGKMVYGLNKLAGRHYFKYSDKVLIYHSGGLQGWNGHHYLKSKRLI
ncbi:MAG: pyridoxal-phosphate dependent enzyme [Saprospiraceae bacterium]